MSDKARFFTGEFEHTVDSVNRLIIPSKWRLGQAEELYLFAERGQEGRIAVLPTTETAKIQAGIEAKTDLSLAEKREKSREIFSKAAQVTCDKQGRITLDGRLLKHAGLKASVVLVGVGTRFEIWNPKIYEGRLKAEASKPGRVLDEYGI